MMGSFKTGARCNLYFFIFEALIVLIMSICFHRMPTLVIIGFAVPITLICIMFGVNIHKKFLSENAHKRIQSLAFFVMDGFLSIAFDSAQVFIYAVFFSAVTLFVFLDPKLARFHMIASVLVVILVAAIVSSFTGSQQTMLEFAFGTIVTLVTNWVIMSMTNIITFQQRQNYEQERSLDDLLKVVEAKCDQAQEATRSKSLFLANMSHEIRTPINAIMGMNEMILRESSEEEIQNYASEAQIAADSLLGIVNDILDITKIEAGKLSILPVKYDTASMLHDIYNLFQFKTENKKLKFEVVADENLPSKLIGDDMRIKEILTNLLSNAVKYTHEGSVTLRVQYLGEGKVYYCVSDTGIGIKKEDTERLFNAFVRIDENRNRNIEGTGLGLNITYSLLDLMNSTLSVESIYGKGSDFSFVLQQDVADDTPMGKLKLHRTHDHHSYTAKFSATDAKVLVVDDNNINRKVFSLLLKKTNMQITEAASGKECLELVRSNSYDIIFMDHMMPEMDGVETLEALRKLPDNLSSGAPVIALTANAVSGAEEYYLKCGFDGFLSKPVDPRKLEKLIYSLLDDAKLTTEDQTAVEAPAKDNAELPEITGVDWNIGRLHFENDASLLETTTMLKNSIRKDAAELSGYFDDIENMLDSYRIKVHSMKSSAALVGIIPLAGMALELETAARNKNISVIRSLHPIFTERWLSYYSLLPSAVTNGSRDAEQHRSEVEEILAEIRSAAEEMDVDKLDELSAKLGEYAFSADEQEKMERIRGLILDFNIEELLNI